MISNFIEIFLLSIIQGVSEFLPISSAAHLILVVNIYEFKKRMFQFCHVFEFNYNSFEKI